MRGVLRLPIFCLILCSVPSNVLTAAVWTNVGSLTTGRQHHTATILADGKVLVVGGDDGGTTSLASCELFDPVLNTWSVTGSLNTSRTIHAAVALDGTHVLVSGGGTFVNNETDQPGAPAGATVASTDPGAQNMSGLPLLAGTIHMTISATAGGPFTVYDDGQGGWLDARPGTFNAKPVPGSVNYLTGAWTITPLAPFTPVNANAIVSSWYETMAKSAEVWDEGTGQWSAVGDMLASRGGHSLHLITGGKVVAVGGDFMGASSEVFDPMAKTWGSQVNMIGRRLGHGAVLIPAGVNGRWPNPSIVALGGGDATQQSNFDSVEVFDTVNQTWTPAPSMIDTRAWFTASYLSGYIYATGGSDPYAMRMVEALTPSTGVWVQAGTVHNLIAHPNPTPTLAIGGGGVITAGRHYFAVTYVTANGESIAGFQTNSLSLRFDGAHAAVVSGLPTGPPGTTGRNIYMTKSNQILNPAFFLAFSVGDNTSVTATVNVTDANLVTPAPSPAGLNKTHAGYALVQSDTPPGLLLVGGLNNGGVTESYDFNSDTWTVGDPLNTPRWWHTATTLQDGRTLVAGGFNNQGGVTKSCETHP